jgi:hypothetical protein
VVKRLYSAFKTLVNILIDNANISLETLIVNITLSMAYKDVLVWTRSVWRNPFGSVDTLQVFSPCKTAVGFLRIAALRVSVVTKSYKTSQNYKVRCSINTVIE